MANKKLEVNDLRISFWTNNGTVKAVRDISFDVKAGETLAIVGESGSGKSVTSRAIMGILAPNAIVEGGEIYFEGMDLLQISEEEYNKLRGNRISMIFQDPLSSLNPITRVGKQITEAMIANNKSRRKSAERELSRLETALLEIAKEAGRETEAKEKLNKFNSYIKAGHKLGGKFTDATNSLETVSKQIGYIRLDLFGDTQVEDLVNKLKAVIKDSETIYHEFTVKSENSSIKAELTEALDLALNFKTIAKEYDKALEDFETAETAGSAELESKKATFTEVRKKSASEKEAISEILEKVQEKCDTILDRKEPDFLTVGYALVENKASDILDSYSSDKEESLEAEFYTDFLDDFLKLVADLQELETKRSKEVSAQLINELDKDIDEIDKNFNIKYLEQRHKTLSAEVDNVVNRLEVNRDSFILTVSSALKDSINKFKNIQKRRKRKKEHLSELEADNLEEAVKNNINRNFNRLVSNLNKKYNAKHDYAAEAKEIVAYISNQAADANYRLTGRLAETRAIDLLDEVGIPEARKRFTQYPFQFSGGMRQRVVIAIALSSNPDLLICDEPTTALDVTIQAQILDLIKELKQKRHFSVIFITHDLGVVANIADKIAVMYAGKIVEYGTADDIFYDPKHPYTWGLLSSMPDLETKEKLVSIPGTPPNMIAPPEGDAFAQRNKYALAIDFEEEPPFFKVSDTHSAATWLLHEKAPKVEPPLIVTERIERMTRSVAEITSKEAKEIIKESNKNTESKEV